MDEAESDLYRRIEAFAFDAPGATYTFAQRLSRENGWSPEFTDRAILEYRRFAFLSVIAGHPVSPPEAIDQVWHLHLLYTRSYWQDFCQGTLGMSLHHEPSVGGAGERAKFAGWYDQTRATYRRYFGEPPAELWPDPIASAAAGTRFCRVDLSRHWILSRRAARSILRGAAAIILLLGILLLASGCDQATERQWNPLEFRGPSFLLFYGVSLTAACILAWTLRLGIKEPYDAARFPNSLDPYQIAFLNGGAKLVTDTAIASLCRRGLLKVSGDGTLRRGVELAIPASPHPPAIEQAVFEAVGAGRARISRVRGKVASISGKIGQGVQNAGLVVSEGKNASTIAMTLLIVMAIPAIGIVKIFVGMQRGRPVGFLIAACAISIVLGLVLFARRVHRTRQGDAVLDHLRTEHREIRKSTPWIDETLVLGVALWGVSVLTGPEWSQFRAAIAAAQSSYSGSGDSSGGSSCGGGGGCGGGGCGGCGS